MRRRAVHATAALAALLLASTLAVGLLGGAPGERDAPVDQASTSSQGAGAAGETSGHDPDHEHAHGPDHTSAAGGYPAPESRRGTVAPVTVEHEHFRAGEPGQVPTRGEAGELPHQFKSFTVRQDGGLAEMDERGYLQGAGTLEEPYVIDGFRVRGDLTIEDTSKPIVIRNSYIEGQLTLNYNGPHVYVHHTYIHDLRVNENVERHADTTAGLFEHNEIAFIGQLRHFGGEFARNAVGPRPDGVATQFLSDTGPRPLPDDIVWNFDGYHRGLVHNNTVDGRVDVKLHGHFHGTCNACPGHDHAEPAGFPEGNQRADGLEPATEHSLRYHTLVFRDNRISVEETGIGLRFHDSNHAGDDQTANSEPNEYLEDLHDHHLYLQVAGNRIFGGSLLFDIVNADDERHDGQVLEALADLTGNHVRLGTPDSGQPTRGAYVVHAADGLTLQAGGNTFTFTQRDSALPAGYKWVTRGQGGETTGFLLHHVETSRVVVTGTRGEGASYGLVLDRAEEGVSVELADNQFNAKKEDVHHA